MPQNRRNPFDFLAMKATLLTAMIAAESASYRLYIDFRKVLWIADPTGVIQPLFPGNRQCRAGEDLADKSGAYLSSVDGKWYPINLAALPIGISRVYGIVNNGGMIAKEAMGIICIDGVVEGYSGLTPGLVYAGLTPGSITQTPPLVVKDGSITAAVMLGSVENDGTKIIVSDSDQGIIYQRRASNMANGGTLTITHHADRDVPIRVCQAFASSNAAVPIGSYALANMDTQVTLNGVLRAAVAQPFTVNASATLNTVRVILSKVNNPTDTLTCAIYTNVAGAPNTLVATATSTLATSTLTTIPTAYDFPFAGAALTAGVSYFITITAGALVTLFNYVQIGMDSSAPTGGMALGALTVVWAPLVPTSSMVYELYSTTGTNKDEPLVVGKGGTSLQTMRAAFTNSTTTVFTNATGATLTDVTVSVIVK